LPTLPAPGAKFAFLTDHNTARQSAMALTANLDAENNHDKQQGDEHEPASRRHSDCRNVK
jgi:hypothetical protein